MEEAPLIRNQPVAAMQRTTKTYWILCEKRILCISLLLSHTWTYSVIATHRFFHTKIWRRVFKILNYCSCIFSIFSSIQYCNQFISRWAKSRKKKLRGCSKYGMLFAAEEITLMYTPAAFYANLIMKRLPIYNPHPANLSGCAYFSSYRSSFFHPCVLVCIYAAKKRATLLSDTFCG